MKFTKPKPDRRAIFYCFTFSFIAVIACYRIVALLNLDRAPQGWGLLPLVLAVGAGSVPFIFPNRGWKSIVPMLWAIPFAIFVDATYDFYANHIDRNLFPLEVVFWWVVMPLPMLIGYWAGCFIAKVRG